MFRFFHRHDTHGGAEVRHTPPPPVTPIEIGLSLRAGRERERLTLEQVRERIDVPVVDLDALERGRLDLFHLEQAAVVALWRYSELLGLDPVNFVDVLHRSWPTGALSSDSFRPLSPMASTPLAQLAAASSMLNPIVRPGALVSSSGTLGLSSVTIKLLSAASLGAARAVAAIGPGGQRTTQTLARPSKTPAKKIAAKQTAAAREAAAPAPVRAKAPAVMRQFPTPQTAATREVDQAVAAALPPDTVVTPVVRPAAAVASEPPATPNSDAEVVVAPPAPARPVGHWTARLTKVVAERFGATPNRPQR